jgi:hypothetical protein
MPNVHSCLGPAHDPPHSAVVQDLEVSRGDVLQHQLLRAQLTHQTLQLRVLLLQLLQPRAWSTCKPPHSFRNRWYVCSVMPFSRHAIGVPFPFATATPICDSKLTICSGICFFPRAISGSFCSSFSHHNWYKKNRALQHSRSQPESGRGE